MLFRSVKVNKTNLKKVVGRKLAARVLKTWTEDFVDEDTGEVVSIERNEVIIDRETVIEEEHIDEIIDNCPIDYSSFCLAYGWIYWIPVYVLVLVVFLFTSGNNYSSLLFVQSKRNTCR